MRKRNRRGDTFMGMRKRISINWDTRRCHHSWPTARQNKCLILQTSVFCASHNSKSATTWSPKAERPPKLRTALHNMGMQHRQKIQHASACSQNNLILKTLLKSRTLVPLEDTIQINLRLNSRPQINYTSHFRGWKTGCDIFRSWVFKCKRGILNLS